MENLTTDLAAILRYLLPGFLSAWIFYGFTSFQKPSQFERVVQALIFTLIVQVLVLAVKAALLRIGEFWSIGEWNKDAELIASVAVAAVLGFMAAGLANGDRFHAWVRKIGLTRETSYPSEWYGEFSNKVTYVVLHLAGERRIYGWPKEWPSSPEKGHFSLNQASWLTAEGETPLEGVETILIPAKDVEMVEFMEKTWEQ